METTKVYLQLIVLRTDPTPYKVYAPELAPKSPLYVAVEVPDKEIVSEDEAHELAISPDGLSYIMSQLAQSFSATFGKAVKG